MALAEAKMKLAVLRKNLRRKGWISMEQKVVEVQSLVDSGDLLPAAKRAHEIAADLKDDAKDQKAAAEMRIIAETIFLAAPPVE